MLDRSKQIKEGSSFSSLAVGRDSIGSNSGEPCAGCVPDNTVEENGTTRTPTGDSGTAGHPGWRVLRTVWRFLTFPIRGIVSVFRAVFR
jgi:hypothetical protein